MPELPEETFVRALELLVTQDRDWVPDGEGKSLYLRPFMIATQRGLGVNHPSAEYLFCVIASPAASYFGEGKTVKVWMSEDYTRAAARRYRRGQVRRQLRGRRSPPSSRRWTRAATRSSGSTPPCTSGSRRWAAITCTSCTGPGRRPALVTPELTGSLLPGITRDSLLRLAPTLGVPVEEGRISVTQWREDCASGELTEVFGCGTAAVITPIGAVDGASGGWTIGDGTPGPVTQRLKSELIDIQYGHKPDPFGWIYKVA